MPSESVRVAFDPTLPLSQSVETVRSRLQQLTTSLQALQHRVLYTNPLPAWTHIQSSLSVILSQLGGLVDTLQRGENELRRIVTVPSHTFPIREHESLLTTLYRTKPLPETEAWQEQNMENGRILPAEVDIRPLVFKTMEEDEMEDEEEEEEYSAAEWFQARRNRRQWTGFYTRKEMDQDFEIDRDDLDDIRKYRQTEAQQGLLAMKAMLRYARSGKR